MTSRDRDEGGRARQARPRDELGRPLPYGEPSVEPVPEEPMPALETIAAAKSYLDDGRPFAAHEVYETRWKTCPPEERELWKGLAQLCVGITHAARGNHVGASRLVERGVSRLTEYDGPAHGLDLDAEIGEARRRLESSRRRPEIEPDRLRSPRSSTTLNP